MQGPPKILPRELYKGRSHEEALRLVGGAPREILTAIILEAASD